MTKVSVLLTAASIIALSAHADDDGVLVEFLTEAGGSETWEVCDDDAFRHNDGQEAEADWSDGNRELCLDFLGSNNEVCFVGSHPFLGNENEVNYQADNETSGLAFVSMVENCDD